MSKIPLTVATWDYDRVRALIDGRVAIEGCEVNYLVMPVEEIFFRAFSRQEFDVTELGFSPHITSLSRGTATYAGIPAFLSRSFRHSGIYVRNDRGIERPEDLRGKRVGVPEYQMTAALWIRGFLKDDHGIEAGDVQWLQGGLENPGRRDKFPLNLPAGFSLSPIPEGASLARMLADGALDAVVSARAPSTFLAGHPRIRRLFPDYRAAEQDYYRRTGLFPIMHAVGLRRDLDARYPWLAASVFKAFSDAKRLADADLREVTALKIGLPWIAAETEATEKVMGADFWPYGVAANRKTLEAMARYSHEQGIAVRRVAVEEMFAAGTLEVARV